MTGDAIWLVSVMPDRHSPAMRFAGALLSAAMLLAAPAFAEPTPVGVRFINQGAKFVGDSIDGAQVILRDVESGRVLTEGITTGGTGNTDRIMLPPGRIPLRTTEELLPFTRRLISSGRP